MTDLPADVIEEAERLTCLASDAVDPTERSAYERARDRLLGEYGYTGRLRDEDETLVCYPTDWVDDGFVRVERIEDTDRAVERALDGPGANGAWEPVEAHNAALVEAVEAEGGPVHAANARAFADFMGNHYARRVEMATAAELREFLDEYFPRNVWPTDEQASVLHASLERLFEAADADLPTLTERR